MTTDTPMPKETPPVQTADLESADAAEAPDIAEELADQLEADLEDIAGAPGGEA